MRILFITNLYPPYHIGGYEIACKDIAEGFKRKGHIIRVLTSTYGIKGRRKNNTVSRMLDIKLKLSVSQTLFEKGQTLFFNLQNYKITKDYVSNFKPDIVSFWSINGISASTIYAVERLGVPKVFHLFDRSLSYLRKVGKKRTLNLVLFDRLGIDNLISSSSELKKDYLVRGFVENDITTIPHGVDLDEYPFKEKKINGILKLLFVGQLWEAKGLPVLLKAIALLKEKGVLIKLIVVGSGEMSYIKHLNKLCNKLNIEMDVTFTGKVKRSKIMNIYHENHLLIFPSIWKEPFGIVLLEAMATGTAVIVSNCGGPLDIVVDGENGYLFEKSNEKDLEKKILAFERNRELIRELGNKARKRIETYFNIKEIVEKHNHLYKSIANGN